jgi:hypothetical protein
MLRTPVPGHRRYSITHRAVQRLREMVTRLEERDDETLRDELDAALSKAEDDGRAVKTLDAMLGEPQVLIPVEAFGDPLFAIIKEDTVVTVLPKGHGEEILQRGQALEQRVATGAAAMRTHTSDDDRWDGGARRRWRRDPVPTVIVRGQPRFSSDERDERDDQDNVVTLPERRRPEDPVAAALFDALERGRRLAAVKALRDALNGAEPDDDLLPLWNEMSRSGLPHALKVGDLLTALDAGT